MKLKKVLVRDFQSIRNSNEFDIQDITCLVGKNEAGKTAILKAMYKLNPIIQNEGDFDVISDFPRADVEDYQYEVETGKSEIGEVITATFELEDFDLEDVISDFGDDVITDRKLILIKKYDNTKSFILRCDFLKLKSNLLQNAELTPEISDQLSKFKTAEECVNYLSEQEQTSEVTRLNNIFKNINTKSIEVYLYETYIKGLIPKFLYFDEYYQLRGFENIESLKKRITEKRLLSSDHPMLGLIELARLEIDNLITPSRTQELVNKLEGAGNHLSKKILMYWSQNQHLQMKFDVRPARPGDPEGMTNGTNIWAGVYDRRHMVTTNLGSRSRGFVWFFSFLAWYSQIQRKHESIILLLDEPGLFLHAKAQADLLNYFEQELKSNHQLIYTTHSPFMVDSHHFEKVRIIQDKGIDSLEEMPKDEEGTKVLNDVFEASIDSLFPLQGALGYDLYQNLFIGPNCLIVEGASDLLYLQTMSELLQSIGKEGLSDKWTITPVGGSDKVPTFIALIGAQKGLKLATLIDIQKKDKQLIENLYKRKLLKKNFVLTFGDFISKEEADIEDIFSAEFYLKLVNQEFSKDLSKKITIKDILNTNQRLLVKLASYFETNPLKDSKNFSHYRPARYFTEKISELKKEVDEDTIVRFEEIFKKLNSFIK